MAETNDPFPTWTYGQTLHALERLLSYSGPAHAPRLLASLRRLIAAETDRIPVEWLLESAAETRKRVAWVFVMEDEPSYEHRIAESS